MRVLAVVAASTLAIAFLWVPAGAAFEVRPTNARAAALCAEALGMLQDLALPDRPDSVTWTVAGSSGGLYGLPGASTQVASLARSGRRKAARLLIGRLGSPPYEERTLAAGVSWSPAAGTWILCDLRALNLRAAPETDTWAGAVDVAVCRVVFGRLVAGASIENVGRSRVLSSDVPVVHTLGFLMRLDGVSLVAGSEIEAGFEPASTLGCEMTPASSLALRFGLGFDPGRVGAGLGTEVAGVEIDVAWQWHPLLGASTRVSVTRVF